MAPSKVRMVLVEGESADGAAVDQDDFDVAESSPSTAPSQVVSAILGTQEGAAEGGYRLVSAGVTWTDHAEAAILRDALKAHKIENVMLVSAFMAAAALAQAVGDAANYAHTALLFVQPYAATLAVVDTADGSVSEVRRTDLAEDEDQAVAEIAELASSAESLEARPDGVVVVGSGVDIPLIQPALEAATALDVSVPDEPEMALARGAALASANAPVYASGSAGLAYALDPGTGEVDPLALSGEFPGLLPGYLPEYRGIPVDAPEENFLAYSAVPEDETEAHTVIDLDGRAPRRRSILLVGSILAAVFLTAAVALEVALAMSIRPTVAQRPSPSQNVVVPAQAAPAPAPPEVGPPEIQAPAPRELQAPAPPELQAPAPVADPDPIGPPVPAAPPPIGPPPDVAPALAPPIPGIPDVGPPPPWAGGPRGFGGPHEHFEGGPGPRWPFGLGGHGFGGHGFGGHGFGGHDFGGHGFGGHGGWHH